METDDKRWERITILSNGNKLTEYQDYARKFRWRLQAGGNNEIIVASSQGFADKRSMLENYNTCARHFKSSKFVVQKKEGRPVRPHRSGGGKYVV